MTHNDFFKAVKAGQTGSLYLMEGTEEYIKQTAFMKLREALLPSGLEALNETVLENPVLGDVMAAVETLPFMAEKRLVTVRECALFRSSKKGSEDGDDAPEDGDTKAFLDYLAHVPPTTCLVFYEKGKADARKKLYGAIKKHGEIASFEPLNGPELNRWIVQTMRGLGKEISPALASTLAFTVGRDAALLRGEMEKLAAYAQEQDQVTAEDIQTVAVKSLEASVFDMVDALVEGKADKAFALYEKMLITGSSRFAVLAMILRQYRILFQYKTLKESGASPGEIRSQLGIPPFAADRAARQAAAYTSEQLKAAMDLCVSTEFSVKSGRMAEEGSVERAMLVLTQLRAEKA